MKIPALALCAALFMVSCSSTKTPEANLPKDISERPADENSQKYDQAQLDKMRASIESEILKEKCTDVANWTFSPIGAKACGGPQSYIAYPKDRESDMLPKINEYTEKVKAFNQKYGITSDCMMVNEPSGIKCNNGKAELINS